MAYLKQLPLQLLLSITSAFFLSFFLPVPIISFFFTLSSCFIEALLFFLPFLVFSYMFRAIATSKKKSLFLLLFIFLGVTVSNFVALLVSYLFGISTLPLLGLAATPDFLKNFHSDVSLLFTLHLPKIISMEMALLIGIACGFGVSFIPDDKNFKLKMQRVAEFLTEGISLFLKRVFIPFLPLYVFGFCLKLSYDQTLTHLFQQFGKVFFLSMSLVSVYLFLLYFIGAGGDLKKTGTYLRNMLPAGLTGFSTMSSAASIPVTLACTEKNTQDTNFSNIIIPSTANIHMLGDDLMITLSGLTLLSIFGMPWPGLTAFISFAIAFSLALLCCVGAPGATILVVLPVLHHYLNFTPEMMSMITTIYILQDPFGTASNVLGNGGFALVVKKLFKIKLESKDLITTD